MTASPSPPIAPIEVFTLVNPALATAVGAANDRASYEQAIARVAAAAGPHRGSGQKMSVGPEGVPAFQNWVGRNPDRLAVQVGTETWNAAVIAPDTLLISRML